MTWQIFSISRMFSLYFTITEAENIVLVLVRYVGIPMYFFFSPCRWLFQRRKEFVQLCENTKEARGSGLLGLVSLNP